MPQNLHSHEVVLVHIVVAAVATAVVDSGVGMLVVPCNLGVLALLLVVETNKQLHLDRQDQIQRGQMGRIRLLLHLLLPQEAVAVEEVVAVVVAALSCLDMTVISSSISWQLSLV